MRAGDQASQHMELTVYFLSVFVFPGVTAGRGVEVIFADGTFIDGSTAEACK
jgi:hypothetical protein